MLARRRRPIRRPILADGSDRLAPHFTLSVCVCVTFVTCEVRVCGLRCRSGSSLYIYRVYFDQVIREDPAVRSSYVRGRGTETSAEVLVGPPWRMESNAGQQQWY